MPFFDVATAEYWDALNNRPKLVSSRGQRGLGYIVGTAGFTELDGHNTWDVNDIAVFGLDRWLRIAVGDGSPSVQRLQDALRAYGVWQDVMDLAIIPRQWNDPVVLEWQFGYRAPYFGILYNAISIALGWNIFQMTALWILAGNLTNNTVGAYLVPKAHVMRLLSSAELQTVKDYVMNNFEFDTEESIMTFNAEPSLISYPSVTATAWQTALGYSAGQMTALWAAALVLAS